MPAAFHGTHDDHPELTVACSGKKRYMQERKKAGECSDALYVPSSSAAWIPPSIM